MIRLGAVFVGLAVASLIAVATGYALIGMCPNGWGLAAFFGFLVGFPVGMTLIVIGKNRRSRLQGSLDLNKAP